MKNEEYGYFENKYNYFFKALENLYLTKSNGLDRVKFELQCWDKETQKIIVDKLINMLIERELVDFKPEEILQLIKQ
jgi:transcriptional antiterminator